MTDKADEIARLCGPDDDTRTPYERFLLDIGINKTQARLAAAEAEAEFARRERRFANPLRETDETERVARLIQQFQGDPEHWRIFRDAANAILDDGYSRATARIPTNAQAYDEAKRRWPLGSSDPRTSQDRSSRRLAFQHGVSWARGMAMKTEDDHD